MLSALLWYLLLTLLSWLTFPLAYRLLPGLRDRGYALSRTLGLLLWGYVFWLLASLGVLYNTPGGVWAGLVGLAVLSVLIGHARWGALRAWLREHAGMVLITEVLFALAFAFMTVVRAAVPEILGTEKPMELAFINAILHSPTFPPHDPWLSGYAISYYYFGYVLVAMLAQVTHTAAPVAFNLGLSTVFALSAVGAYGVAYDLFPVRHSPASGKKPAGTGAALLAPLFLLLMGNAEALLEAFYARGWFWRSDGTSPFWAWLDIKDLTSAPQALASHPTRFWWWWRASRVLQDYSLSGAPKEIIDEFPAFSYVLGDLHPHVLAMPFALLAVGLALNLYRGGARGRMRWWWMTPSGFGLAALALGGMAFLNTWDFPIYVGLFAAAYALRQAHTAGWSWERLGEFLSLGAALGIAGGLLYLPFYAGFSSQAGGLIPNLVYVTRGAHLWVMFGTLFVPLLSWLISLAGNGQVNWRRGLWLGCGFLLVGLVFALLGGVVSGLAPATRDIFLGSMDASSPGMALVAAFQRRLSAPGGWLTLLILLMMILARLSIASEDAPTGTDDFPLLLALFAVLLVAVPEFVFLRDQFGWRMNTIFKFYYQAWLLFALAAAYGVTVTLQRARVSWRVVTSLGLAAALWAGVLFSYWGFASRTDGLRGFSPSRWSLDGGGYLREASPDDMAAIDALRAGPPGVVAEAVGGSYSAFARVATYSGHPTVLGWPGHESQWRGGAAEMGSREVDIRRLYETANWTEAQTILQQYGVGYVFVGSLERQTYRVSERKFEQNLVLIFEQGQTRLYRVP
ncbi:MAG: DUF2298 domain-containing protein [Anaerolineales bacterium]